MYQNRPGYGLKEELLGNRRSLQLTSKSQYRYFVTIFQPPTGLTEQRRSTPAGQVNVTGWESALGNLMPQPFTFQELRPIVSNHGILGYNDENKRGEYHQQLALESLPAGR